jgi:gliding motility-associated-like protein
MKSILFTISFLFILNSSFSQRYADDCLDSLEVPSAFTPNGDAIDDFISIHFECPPEEFTFTVYNRWGEEVYTTDDYKFQWAGVDKDEKPLPAGVIIWKFKYTFNDKEVSKTGHLSLVL